MTTRVHHDETAPKRERYRVLRAQDETEARWITVESFPTEREAHAFAQGFTLGNAYAPPPEPIEARLDRALGLVRLARDDYKARIREAQAVLRHAENYSDPIETALRRLTDPAAVETWRGES